MKPKITKITLKHEVDTNPRTSWLGKYTDSFEDGVIVVQYDKFFEHLTQDEKDNIEKSTHEFNCFKPDASGEKMGTKEYYEFGMQDYKKMKELERGEWVYLGIYAEAEVSYPIEDFFRLECLSSGGIWGIESDSDSDHIKQIEKEELEDLKKHLEIFNVDVSNFDKIEVKYER